MYNKHRNRLGLEKSPYLLQHSDNPVNWYPWGEDAFEKAKRENKPVFLSIGYSTCHWCHVMEHESFEDIEVARLMNETFISVKVDREERPDIDMVYMSLYPHRLKTNDIKLVMCHRMDAVFHEIYADIRCFVPIRKFIFTLLSDFVRVHHIFIGFQ